MNYFRVCLCVLLSACVDEVVLKCCYLEKGGPEENILGPQYYIRALEIERWVPGNKCTMTGLYKFGEGQIQISTSVNIELIITEFHLAASVAG